MRTLNITALIGLSLTVAACGGGAARGLESVHQPVVKRSQYVLDIDTTSDGVSSMESRRVAGWLDALRVGYGDRVSIEVPYGSGGGSTREVLAALAAKHGLLLDDSVPVTAGDVAPGMARMIVSRVTATVPGCPDWSGSSMSNFSNRSMSNYGCAVNSNVASMVANPQDLVLGAENTNPNDTTASSRAVRNYRDGKSNTVKAESARSN